MFKVLIADDEPFVREGLKKIIKWEELGFSICGEGVDGDDTYNKIIQLNPDLTLIDMKMPGKTGISVIKDAVENGYKGKFIIISGYSDFSYVKEAMKYGIKNYLLKPIDEDELTYIVQNLKEEIEKENFTVDYKDFEKELIKANILEKLCYNSDMAEVEDYIKEFNHKSYNLALINYKIHKFSENNLVELEKYIKKKLTITQNSEIFKIKNNIAILFYDRSENNIINILQNLKSKIDKDFTVDTFITLSIKITHLSDLNTAYKNAIELMEKRFLYLNYGLITNKTIKNDDIFKNENIDEIMSDIYTYIEIGEKEKIKENISKLKMTIKAYGYSEEKTKAIITTNFLKCQNDLILNYKLNLNVEKRNKYIIEKIYVKDNLDEILSFLEDEFISTTDLLLINTTDNAIKRIVKFVDKKYYNDLKLEYLSEIFNYNSSYLGKLFKSTTGKSFNSYLDNIRIEKAKELIIEDKYKVYEICEMVGYKNIDYFYCKFKKYVGVSPLNYKKQMMNIKIMDN